MFWNKFVDLCVDSGKSPTPVCTELGFSSAVVVKWKRGAIPRDTTLKKLADYFGVPMSYFTEKEKPSDEGELSEKNVVTIIGRDGSFSKKKLTDDQIKAIKALIDQLPDATDEDL